MHNMHSMQKICQNMQKTCKNKDPICKICKRKTKNLQKYAKNMQKICSFGRKGLAVSITPKLELCGRDVAISRNSEARPVSTVGGTWVAGRDSESERITEFHKFTVVSLHQEMASMRDGMEAISRGLFPCPACPVLDTAGPPPVRAVWCKWVALQISRTGPVTNRASHEPGLSFVKPVYAVTDCACFFAFRRGRQWATVSRRRLAGRAYSGPVHTVPQQLGARLRLEDQLRRGAGEGRGAGDPAAGAPSCTTSGPAGCTTRGRLRGCAGCSSRGRLRGSAQALLGAPVSG